MPEVPDPFADVAGAVPNSGVSVRGLRVLVDHYDRDASPGYMLIYVLSPLASSLRYRLTVYDEAGSKVARISEVKRERRAKQIRERFVGAVTALRADEYTNADWQRLLEASVDAS